MSPYFSAKEVEIQHCIVYDKSVNKRMTSERERRIGCLYLF